MQPSRKKNRLAPFDYNSRETYFITICTKDKKCILGTVCREQEGDPAAVRLSETGKIVRKYIESAGKSDGITIEKYVIMPNHIHLLVFVQNELLVKKDFENKQHKAIPTMVGAIKRLTNREIGENIFQRSFYDHIIRNDRDYEKIWDYIEGNPAEWLKDRFFR